MKNKILVVDDEPGIVRVLKLQLEQWGYEIISSEDGLNCMQLVESEHPDLVLLDIRMPGLDGMSVCSELSTSYDIPIIIMSGVTDKSTIDDSGIFGAIEYIAKPIDMEELKSKVRKSLDSYTGNNRLN